MSSFALWVVLLAAADGPARDEARDETRAARAAYDLGRYDEACRRYEHAYRLVHDAALLFNIGQCSRLGGHRGRALAAYRSYLRTGSPEPAHRRRVRDRIEELEAATAPGAAAEKTPSPVPPAALPARGPPTPVPTPVYRRWWFWPAVGAVAAGAVVAVAVGSRGDGLPSTPLGTQSIF